MFSCIEISNKIIGSSDSSQGEIVSNLKLQKMLYYLQGFHLAIYETRLFKEDIEAWQYGPVVKEAYTHFNKFGSNAIELEKGTEIITLSAEQEILFSDVMDEFGQYSAIKLMRMTHSELPWKRVFPVNPQGIISDDLLKEYFKTQIVE